MRSTDVVDLVGLPPVLSSRRKRIAAFIASSAWEAALSAYPAIPSIVRPLFPASSWVPGTRRARLRPASLGAEDASSFSWKVAGHSSQPK
jgi:hypothetical protein